jgi:hypothetical protein
MTSKSIEHVQMDFIARFMYVCLYSSPNLLNYITISSFELHFEILVIYEFSTVRFYSLQLYKNGQNKYFVAL